MWLAIVIALGTRPPVPADLIRFGWDRQPCGCPPTTHYRVAAYNRRSEAEGMRATWYAAGQPGEFQDIMADLGWRLECWRAADCWTDTNYDAAVHSQKLQHLIGPACWQMGVMPEPYPGAWAP